jgi:type I pantothenate kinase
MTSLDHISDLVRARAARSSPYLLGVTGAVGAGKSTFSAQLAGLLTALPAPLTVEVVGADGFLMDNAALEALGFLNRKGFPESFDVQAMRRTLAAIRTGPAAFPGYSHTIYDIDPALTRQIEPPGVLIVEGLGLHDGAAAAGLDALVYLDADEALIEGWFTARFLEFWRAAETDPKSFYARFRHLDEAGVRGVAAMVWREINLPNLRDHISKARETADFVVTKGAGHQILSVRERGAARGP